MKSDFIYDAVLNGCLREKVDINIAKDAAMMASEKYKKGKYEGKPSKLIETSIKQAKRI